MLRNMKCELMVEIMLGNESNVFNCDNTSCLIAVNIIEITFVGLLYYFVRL
jgi:hypothetical protein